MFHNIELFYEQKVLMLNLFRHKDTKNVQKIKISINNERF